MKVVEAQFNAGKTQKTDCDFCDEKPENGVLIEKPNSLIINGEVILSHRPKPLYICLECLTFELENI